MHARRQWWSLGGWTAWADAKRELALRETRRALAAAAASLARQKADLARFLTSGTCSGLPAQAVGSMFVVDLTESRDGRRYQRLRARVRAARRRKRADEMLREAAAAGGDDVGRWPIECVVAAVRRGSGVCANMVKVKWEGRDPLTQQPWGTGWTRVAWCTADVQREAVRIMNATSGLDVRCALAIVRRGGRVSMRIALQREARRAVTGRLRRTAGQVEAAVAWDLDEWKEEDGTRAGVKRTWRQRVVVMSDDSEGE